MSRKNKHNWGHQSLLWTLILFIAATAVLGARHQAYEIDRQVMAAELSQLPIARSKVQELATKDAELKTLRQVAEATKSAKPNVIYIDTSTNKGKAMDAAKKAWGAEYLKAFEQLIMHESGFNALAVNVKSGACGLFQALPCSKMKCQLHDVDCQINWGLAYISNRYQNPNKAWNWWQEHSWY